MKLFAAYLIFFLVFEPVVFAASKKVALIEVFEHEPSRKLTNLRYLLEKRLSDSRKVELVSPEKIRSYFQQGKLSPQGLVQGDVLVEKAERQLFNDDTKACLSTLNHAVGDLSHHPGIQGSLIRAYLMRAQVFQGMKKKKEAVADLEKAVSINGGAQNLDLFSYPPALAKGYRAAYASYSKNHRWVSVKVETKGADNLPIYLNGQIKGHGPVAYLKIPQDTSQLISAGNAGAIKTIKNTQTKTLNVSLVGTNQKVRSLGVHSLGFEKMDSDAALLSEGVALGKNVHADYVVMLELTELNYFKRLNVRVANVPGHSLSAAKPIDVMGLASNADSIASVVADYITHLDAASFVSPKQESHDPVLLGKKKNKTLLWGAIGVLVAGAAAGTVLLLSGSSGSSNSSVVSVSGARFAH